MDTEHKLALLARDAEKSVTLAIKLYTKYPTTENQDRMEQAVNQQRLISGREQQIMEDLVDSRINDVQRTMAGEFGIYG